MAMTIKNNFAILNLVKTFLTSITFDSLSEKIKNLRLVIKKFQTKEDILMRNIKKIFTLVLSLILLLAVSCSNDDKTGIKNNPPENDTEITDGETGTDGDSATDLPNGYYKGNLTCKTCIIGDDFHADESSYGANYKEEFEQENKNWLIDNLLYLKIANNKLKWSSYEDALEGLELEEREALKSGSEYSATSLTEYDTTDSIGKGKATIKFTISGDTISITYISKVSQENKDGTLKLSVDATYEGTLTKYTSTTSLGS